MFAKVDVSGLIGAAMMIAGLVCFLTSDYFLPVWAAYLGGPLLWFFGTVVAIIWIVSRFFTVSSDHSAAMPTAVSATKINKSIRAALLICAGILNMTIYGHLAE